ncbi:MAG: DUF1801 domain-containing protein [Pseudomonadales bacterium]
MSAGIDNPAVAVVYETFPARARSTLLGLRKLLIDTAERMDGVGPITETVKWGEPAYLTEATGSGTTVRLGWKASTPDCVYVYVHCQTTLIDDFRTMFPELEYQGNRAIVLPLKDPLPADVLRECFAQALTYHQRKPSRTRSSTAP